MSMSHPAVPFVAPFAAFMLFIAVKSYIPYEYPIRVAVVGALALVLSRRVISLRTARPLLSVLAGVLVFAIWIGPDALWPAYRQHWLFNNAVIGSTRTSLHPYAGGDHAFLFFRIMGTAILVPIIEELFWRGWLMRFLISPRFERVALGAFSASSFWLTAILFASEHGPYWDVGLLAGIVYNAWMIKTKSLGDCILAHTVTNACLAAYVLLADQWQYWL